MLILSSNMQQRVGKVFPSIFTRPKWKWVEEPFSKLSVGDLGLMRSDLSNYVENLLDFEKIFEFGLNDPNLAYFNFL